MDCSHKAGQKSKKSRLRIILTLVVMITVVGGLLGYYWPHLLWKYSKKQLDPLLKRCERVSHSPMPKIDVPNDWVEHSLGDMWFRLPPDASFFKNTSTAESYDAEFHSENIRFLVTQSSLDIQEVLHAASRTHPEHKTFSTLSQLRLESCGVVADDFRWSMSHREVRWHIFIVSLRPLIVLPNTERIESFSERNWEGLLFVLKASEYASVPYYMNFEWECTSCPTRGAIYFYPAKEEEVDIDVVRAVIQSLKVNCGCCEGLPDAN